MCNTNDVARTGQPSRERVGSAVKALAVLDLLAEHGPLGTNEIARRTGTTREHRLAPSRHARRGGPRRARRGDRPLPPRAAARPARERRARPARRPRARAPPPRGARRRDRRDDDALRPGRAGRDHRRLRGEPALRPRRDAARPPVGRARDRGGQGDARVQRTARPSPPLAAFTERTITDPAALEAELARIRKAGWAEAYEEREPELNAIAAPVWSAPGELAAIVAVQGPIPRFGRAVARRAVPAAARARGRDLGRARLQYEPLTPGIQLVPASGTRAIAAASTVSATRSSGSRLWTCDLPQARASVCVSSVSTRR